ncbi:MAG: nitroreductase family protein [Bacilli bacterium]|nr:nitroreductase family protein [Bacilli bacterium]
MLESIKNRRTCRNYDINKIVEEEKINEIVNAGLLAPSGMNRQTPVAIVIKDRATRNRLAKLNSKALGRDADTFYGAPVIIMVIAHKEGLSYHDGAAMMENMLIEATNQGLCSGWIHRADEEIKSEEGREILSFTGLNFDDYVGIGHVIIGYPLGEPIYREKEIKSGRVFIK